MYSKEEAYAKIAELTDRFSFKLITIREATTTKHKPGTKNDLKVANKMMI